MDAGTRNRIAQRADAWPEALLSPVFLGALALLLLNDLVLKQRYPGFVTSKLSDVAGIFAFGFFWAALLPRRAATVCIGTAIGFALWKSPLSQPMIDAMDAHGFAVTRVVDYTDLIALAALPLAYAYVRYSYANGPSRRRKARRLSPAVMLISLIAFGASLCGKLDSIVYELPADDSAAVYSLSFPVDEFPERLDRTGLVHRATRTAVYEVSLDNDPHGSLGSTCRYAYVQLKPTSAGTAMRLSSLHARERCNPAGKQAELTMLFETEVVARLRGAVPPLDTFTRGDGDRHDYAGSEAPSIELNASLASMVRRLDQLPFAAHEFHDGVYELGAFACYARFRMAETPDREHVVVTGVGFETPCYGASSECLSRLFRTFINAAADPTPTPASDSGSVCPKGLNQFLR